MRKKIQVKNNIAAFYKEFPSNWEYSVFYKNGEKYYSVEQYMMAQKAKLFGDMSSYFRILDAAHPRECKELGRKIINFDQTLWDTEKYRIVLEGTRMKYMQNDHLKKLLFEVPSNAEFAEASVEDPIWGIGLFYEDESRFDKEKWRGENLLGKIVTQVRDELLAQQLVI
jgi:ribA/ribD-fused uncharacterized protein